MSGKISNQQLQVLKNSFPRLKIKQNYPLSKLTYFRIGGPASLLVKVITRQDLVDLVIFCREQEIAYVIFGGGSNVVVADEGLDALVIVTQNRQVELLSKSETRARYPLLKNNQVVLRAECGVELHSLVKQAIDQGLTGLEFFAGVPGKLGGAIYNNAHYQNQMIGDKVGWVEALQPNNDVVWLTHSECKFAYDSSRFQHTGEIILRADFVLEKGESQEAKELVKRANLHRAKTQPLALPSSGCIFKNVPNTPWLQQQFPQFQDQVFISAGFLIDQAGLKGLREGDIQVSEEHAGFMVNLGKGKACEVAKLIQRVKDKVKEKFKIELEEEVFWMGR